MATVLIIPDTHSPFMAKNALDFLADLKKEYKPDKIIHLGDECDFHSLGQWGSDPMGMSAGDEHKAAVAQLKLLYKLFPKVTVMESNHTARPFRAAFKAGIPKLYLKQYREFLEAPKGWNWVEHAEIDSVIYMHGENFSGPQGALRCAERNRKSVVIGHLHSYAGIQFSATKWDQIFGFNCGCLIDVAAYGFAYGRTFPSKPVLGAGIVVDGKYPTFIPLEAK